MIWRSRGITEFLVLNYFVKYCSDLLLCSVAAGCMYNSANLYMKFLSLLCATTPGASSLSYYRKVRFAWMEWTMEIKDAEKMLKQQLKWSRFQISSTPKLAAQTILSPATQQSWESRIRIVLNIWAIKFRIVHFGLAIVWYLQTRSRLQLPTW